MTASDRKALTSSGLPQKYHKAQPKDFTRLDEEWVFDVSNWLANKDSVWKEGIGLFLNGDPGTGKTHVMAACFTFLLLNEPHYSCRYMTFDTVISKMTSSWRSVEARKSFLESLSRTKFLFVDDLGSEFQGKDNELAAKALETLLNYRSNANKPLIIGTTLAPSEIEELYGERCSSLIKEICLPVAIEGTDWRENKKNRIKQRLHGKAGD